MNNLQQFCCHQLGSLMKALILLALSMALSGLVYAHGGSTPDCMGNPNDSFSAEMNEIHRIMHNATVSQKTEENSVVFEITADHDETIAAIKKRIDRKSREVAPMFQDIEITTSPLTNGVEIAFISTDEQTTAQLKAAGIHLLYQYLHLGITNHLQGYHGHNDTMYHQWGVFHHGRGD